MLTRVARRTATTPSRNNRAAAAKRRVSTGRLFYAAERVIISSWRAAARSVHRGNFSNIFVTSLFVFSLMRCSGDACSCTCCSARPRHISWPVAGVAHVDNQCSDDSFVNPVPCAGIQRAPTRIKRVISPAIGVAEAADQYGSPTNTGLWTGVRLEDPSRSHIDVRMCVVLSRPRASTGAMAMRVRSVTSGLSYAV